MSDPETQLDGRFGNVAAAVLEVELGEEASEVWDWTARLVHERLWVGQGAPPSAAASVRVEGAGDALSVLVRVLEASPAPSLLLIGAGMEAELALALMASPEADIVMPFPATAGRKASLSALYRCESVLPAARALMGIGVHEPSRLFEQLEATVVQFSR